MTETLNTVSAQTVHHPRCEEAKFGFTLTKWHQCARIVVLFKWPLNGQHARTCLGGDDGAPGPGHRCFTSKEFD